MSTWVSVAELVKPKTLHGGLVVRPAHGLPFLLQVGMEVVFVPPVLKSPKSAVVVEITHLKQDAYLVAFDEVSTIDDAEALSGRYCLVRRCDLPQDFDVVREKTWENFEVHDAAYGFLGVVLELVPNPLQKLLRIQGEASEILIPVVDEFVCNVDEAQRRIDVNIPQSLLDLSKG